MDDNSSIRIYVNKIDNRTKASIQTGCYLKFLTPDTMKLFGSTKIKTIKNENGENVPDLEISEVVSVHCNVVNNNY